MKKRHLFGLFAMAAFAFVGCSQDEVVSQSPDVNKAIEFGTYVGRDASSRATVIDNAKLATDHFGVFAYYTNTESGFDESSSKPNFMYNQEVEGTSITENGSITYNWTYAPLRYWPTGANDKLTFFAYAPYNRSVASLTANNVAGNPKLTFAVNETVKNQIDLLYAGNFNDLKNKTKADDAVNFQFKHALSRIGFKVKASDDRTTRSAVDGATKITVQEVQISFGDTYLASGTLDLGTGTWSHTGVNAASQTYTLSTNTSNLENVEANATAQLLNTADSYIMIIPQDIDSESIKVNVEYTITTTDANVNGGSTVMTGNILTSAPFEFNFEKGKAYNFVLDLGLKTIKLTAEVANWDTPEGADNNVSFGS